MSRKIPSVDAFASSIVKFKFVQDVDEVNTANLNPAKIFDAMKIGTNKNWNQRLKNLWKEKESKLKAKVIEILKQGISNTSVNISVKNSHNALPSQTKAQAHFVEPDKSSTIVQKQPDKVSDNSVDISLKNTLNASPSHTKAQEHLEQMIEPDKSSPIVQKQPDMVSNKVVDISLKNTLNAFPNQIEAQSHLVEPDKSSSIVQKQPDVVLRNIGIMGESQHYDQASPLHLLGTDKKFIESDTHITFDNVEKDGEENSNATLLSQNIFDYNGNAQDLQDHRSNEYVVRPSTCQLEYVNKKNGLFNLGNTCYMNASLQALIHVNNTEWLTWLRTVLHCNATNCVGCSLSKTFRQYEESNTCIKPFPMYNLLGNSVFVNFKKGKEHDSHEFMLALIDSLYTKQKCDPPAVFDGLRVKVTTCDSCKHKSISPVEVFVDLSVSIAEIMNPSTTSAIEFLLKEEKLDESYKCDNCQIRGTSWQTKEFKKLPLVLIVQFDRYDTSGTKIEKFIYCDEKIELFDQKDSFYTYELIATIEYNGNLESGHLITVAKTSSDEYWKFNDSFVSKAPHDFFIDNWNVYNAIYTRMEVDYSKPTSQTRKNCMEDQYTIGDQSAPMLNSTIDDGNHDALIDEVAPTQLTPCNDVGPDNVNYHDLSNKHENFEITKDSIANEGIRQSSSGDNPINYNRDGHTFTVTADFWNKWYPKTPRRGLIPGWTEDFHNNYFQEIYPNCTITFTDTRIYTTPVEKKRTKEYLVAKASCQHSTCTNFIFTCEEPFNIPHSSHKIKTTLSSTIDHSDGTCHARFWKKDRRENLKADVEHSNPSKVKWEHSLKVPSEVKDSGNFNNIPNLAVCQKAKSEGRTKDDLDKDFDVFMVKLREQYIKSEFYENALKVKGFIQHYCSYPLVTILFSEKQLQFLSQLKSIRLHLDATGSDSKVNNTKEKMTIYTYNLFVAGGKDCSPLEIATAYLSAHSITYVQFFLGVFYDNFCAISNRHIQKIEVDFSLVLLHSTIRVFNKMSMLEYVNVIFQNVEKDISVPTLTILHVCSSHFIKNIRKKLREWFPNKKSEIHQNARLIATRLVSALLHSCNADEGKSSFIKLIQIFGLKKKLANLDEIIQEVLMEEFDEFDETDLKASNNTHEPSLSETKPEDEPNDDLSKNSEIDDSEEENGENVTSQKYSNKLKDSLYGVHFRQFAKDTREENEVNVSREDNTFYSVRLNKYLINILMPLFSLWSGAGIAQFGLRRDNNATAETGFKVYKQQMLQKEEKILIPRLIQKVEPLIRAKLEDRKYDSFLTTRQKNKRKTKNQDPKEAETENLIKKKARLEIYKSEMKVKKEEQQNGKANGKKKKILKDKWQRKRPKKRALNKYFKQARRLDEKLSTDSFADLYKSSKITHEKIKNSMKELIAERDKKLKKKEDKRKEEEKLTQSIKEESQKDKPADSEKKSTEIVSSKKDLENLKDNFFNHNYTFPINFPSLTIEVGSIKLSQNDFEQLQIREKSAIWLKDNIINSFFLILKKIGIENNIIIYTVDSQITAQYRESKQISRSYLNNTLTYDAQNSDIWLIPINENNLHWSVILIVPKLKIILHLDSLHHACDPDILEMILKLIRFVFGADVTNWEAFSPKDIPKQVQTNCGVHVCSWGYIIASGQRSPFKEDDMNTVRKSMANLLFKYKLGNNRRRRKTCDENCQFNVDEKIESCQNFVQNKIPLDFSSTLDFCSSLKYLVIKETRYYTRS